MLKRQLLAEIFRLTALNTTKSKELDHIGGNSPFILKEIWVFPNINGISPFIFQAQ
jgi:hypothetical protein